MTGKLVIGNWKMNGRLAANLALLDALQADAAVQAAQVAVAPPFAYLGQAATLLAGSNIALAAQDVSAFDKDGAYTGEVSAAMLADVGCRYVLIGHSERRQYFAEDHALLARKLQAAVAAGLIPVYCVGETLAEREGDAYKAVIAEQLAVLGALAGHDYVVAYEPVWAIGTGKVASVAQIDEVHQFIRETVLQCHGASDSIRVLYGGSVKADNADAILSLQSVGGALVGGASLDVESFGRICQAAKITV